MSFNKKFFTTGGIVASSAAAGGGTDNFSPVIYTGSGTTKSISSLDFKPDLVWIKNRIDATNHVLHDSVRGTSSILYSDLSNSADTGSNFISFDTNGFTVGGSNYYNGLDDGMVAWCWKAGGAASLNENGSIDSQVSANQDAGFSIVKFTAPSGSNVNFTAGHGLSQIPDMVISKVTSRSGTWHVWNKDLPNTLTDYLKLNDNVSTRTFSNMWGTGQTSSVISHRTDASSYAGEDHIAYCFHSVDGYQKVGTYEGNGGVKTVYTDSNGDNTGTGAFQPRWVLIKNADDLGNWMIYDTIRDTDGTVGKFLEANTSDIELDASSAYIVPNSTGFTTGNSNSVHLNKLNQTFIYLAIA